MSLAFRLMYSLGLTPWDHALVPATLRGLVAELPRERALDVGCGTGAQAVWLAEQGFDVVGVDVVASAITRAKARAANAGFPVRFLVGDAATDMELGEPFSLLLDFGCLHAVSPAVRDGLAAAYARLAAPNARLVLFAFPPRRGPGPKGAGRDELEQRFGSAFRLLETRVDDDTPVPRPLARAGRPVWYLWERSSTPARYASPP